MNKKMMTASLALALTAGLLIPAFAAAPPTPTPSDEPGKTPGLSAGGDQDLRSTGFDANPTGNVNLTASVDKEVNLIYVTIPTDIAFTIAVDGSENFASKKSSGAGLANIETGVFTATNGQVVNHSNFSVDVTLVGVNDPDSLLPKMDLALVPVQYATMPVGKTSSSTPVEDYKLIATVDNGDGTTSFTPVPIFTELKPDAVGAADDRFLWVFGQALPDLSDGTKPKIPEGNYTVTTTLKVSKYVAPTP